MLGKFEIKWNYYPTNWNKLIYAENRVGGKAMQHLELYLYINSITTFSTIEDLFNYLEDIFDNSYQKKYALEKFSKLKIGASSFTNFYSTFIWLAFDLEYTSEMFISEFKYMLITWLEDWLNYRLELSTSILALAKQC